MNAIDHQALESKARSKVFKEPHQLSDSPSFSPARELVSLRKRLLTHYQVVEYTRSSYGWAETASSSLRPSRIYLKTPGIHLVRSGILFHYHIGVFGPIRLRYTHNLVFNFANVSSDTFLATWPGPAVRQLSAPHEAVLHSS